MKKPAIVFAIIVALFASACSSQATVTTETTASASSQAANAFEVEAEEPATTSSQIATEPTAPANPITTDATPTDDAEIETNELALVPVSLDGSGDWCTAAAQIENSIGEDSLDLFGDPAALEQAYRGALSLVEQAQSIAPAQIAADVAEFAKTVAAMTQVLDDADWNFSLVNLADIEAVAEQFDVSGDNIERYNFEVCGIGTDPGPASETADIALDTPDFELPDGTFEDAIVEGFIAAGFTEDEARCLAQNTDFLNPEASDPSALFDAFGECGISLDRMSEIGR